MTITEFAIVRFHTPLDLSDPGQHNLLRLLSEWQSACSGFPLHLFADEEDLCLVHLVTGWESVKAHEAWIRGERNQELRTLFGPYVDVKGVRMVHVDVDFGTVPSDGGLVVERYQSDRASVKGDLVGRDLGQSGDVYCFAGGTEGLGEGEVESAASSIKRWVLKRVSV